MTRNRNRLLSALLLALVLALVGSSCASDDPVDAGGSGDDSSGAATDDNTGGDSTGDDAGGTADDNAGGDADTTTTTVLDAGTADVDLSDAPEVVLLDPGAEPRAPLRMTIADGQAEVMVMEQTQEISQTLNGTGVPSAGPIPMIMTMDLAASSLGGTFYEVSSVVSDVGVGEGLDPALASQLETNLAAMIGLTTLATMDDRGRLLESEISGTEGLDPTIVSTMEQMSSNNQMANPLPEEPVGVGARWETTQNLMTNGLEITQTATYELLSINGPVVELSVTVSQSVPPGSIMTAQGLSMTVTEWVANGTGTVTIDLTKIVPTGSQIDLVASQGLEFVEGGQTGVLDQSIISSVVIYPG